MKRGPQWIIEEEDIDYLMCHCAEGTWNLPVYPATKRAYTLFLVHVDDFLHLFDHQSVATFDPILFRGQTMPMVEITRLISFLQDQGEKNDHWINLFARELEKYLRIKTNIDQYRASVARAQKTLWSVQKQKKELKKRLHAELERRDYFKTSLENEELPSYDFVDTLEASSFGSPKKKLRIDPQKYVKFALDAPFAELF